MRLTTFGQSRRLVGLLLSCAMLLAACASGSKPSESPGAQNPTAPSGSGANKAPKSGGALIQAIEADPPILLPPATTGVPDHVVSCKIYEGLVAMNREWTPEPVLATSWDISPDGKTYTFKLRQNVKWQDGKPFSSADVKFTFEKIVAKYAPRASVIMKVVQQIDTPDPHTVVFRLKEPFGPMLSLLNCANSGIAPKHLYEGTDILTNPTTTTKPVGTGPFRMVEWVKGQHIVLERNKEYWDKPKPYLDQMIFKIIPNGAARTLAFEAKEVDYIMDYSLPKDQYQRLIKLPGVQHKVTTTVPTDDILIINTRNKPFDDKRVRQALLMAINRNFIVDKVYFGLATPGKSAITPELPWAHNANVDYEKMYPFNPEKAKALLDEVGLKPGPDGVRLKARAVYDTARPGFQPVMETVRANLKNVGIELTLEGLERQVMLSKVFQKWEFDLTLQTYTTNGDPTSGVARTYISASIGTQNFNNASGYSNPKVDELFAKGASATTIEQRAKHFKEAQEILAVDLPTLTLIHKGSADVARDNVRGLWRGGDYYDFWAEVWLDK